MPSRRSARRKIASRSVGNAITSEDLSGGGSSVGDNLSRGGGSPLAVCAATRSAATSATAAMQSRQERRSIREADYTNAKMPHSSLHRNGNPPREYRKRRPFRRA